MSKDSRQIRHLAAPQRGLIVQRVLVDGQSPARAGAPFGIDGRQVERWVAAYRRYGMASLRSEAVGALTPRRWFAGWFGWIAGRVRGRLAGAGGPRLVRLRRGAPGGFRPDARSGIEGTAQR